MKIGSIICLGLFVIGAILSLTQLWFALLSFEIFIKLIITLTVLFIIVLGVTLVKNEYIEEKKMRKSGHLD